MKLFAFCLAIMFSVITHGQVQKDSTVKVEMKDVELRIVSPSPSKDSLYTNPEIEPYVDQKKWRKHLEDKLHDFFKNSTNNKIPPGTYTVNVRFIVEPDGSIGSVQAVNDPGYQLGKKAVEIVKTGPAWSPGINNGVKVRAYKIQPVTFEILVTEQ